MSVSADYQTLADELRQISLLRSCGAVLGWDEQVNLPPKGAEHRANQLALIAGLAHQRATAPGLGELLAQTEQSAQNLSDTQRANVRDARRHYDRARKLPQRLVEEISRVTTLSQQNWVTARKQQDFGHFKPWLEQVIALKREEASALGSETGNLYDALLDDYEPGATAQQIQSVFTPLRDELVKLVAAIKDSSVKPSVDILERSYPIEQQKEFSLKAAAAIGFDFNAGRLDIAAHPFCSGFGPGDCRLTTRYNEHHFPGAFFGTLHEAGHGIYEQGLNTDDYGLASGDSCSLGIHESQSRMWENLVGRSQPFWKHFFPAAQSAFPAALGDVLLDTFYKAINNVQPSWIRVEADEVTYNLHIMLRFELEQALIAGELSPADVPGVWNEKFASYFGMTPPNDTLGCLQDVHWSAGLLGYFPTYSLGNMYASQFFEKAQVDLGDLAEMFARGEFAALKQWLTEKIHHRGRAVDAPTLVEEVTGKPLTSEPLLRHLNEKFRAIYQI